MSYSIPINVDSRKKAKRTFEMSSIVTPGSGTIYTWDWLWSNNQKGDVGSLDSNSVHFRYVGLAAQLKTSKRISEHIQEAKKSSSADGDRTMYIALGEAIKKGYFKNKKAEISQTGANVVKIIHNVSLFDLANLERYYIKQDASKKATEANTFKSIIDNRLGEKVLLNTSSGGEGDPTTGGTSTGEFEFIIAAYMYLRESDSDVMAARSENAQGNLANEILRKSNNDYRVAVKMLIDKFPGLSRIDTSSEKFDSLLSKFFGKIEVSSFKEEKEIIKDSTDLITAVFGGKSTISIILTYSFNNIKIESQVDKAIYLKEAFSVSSVYSASEIKNMQDNINKSKESIKRENILKQAGFCVLQIAEHYFKPMGYTAVFLLAESHLAIHTFPEENKTYIELSSCVEKQYLKYRKIITGSKILGLPISPNG